MTTVAVRHVADYTAWKPQTETVLDMRLADFDHTDMENELLSTYSGQMGERLVEVYTHTSVISKTGFEALHRNSPKLRVLCLYEAHRTGNAALEVISRFKELVELNLRYADSRGGGRSVIVRLSMAEIQVTPLQLIGSTRKDNAVLEDSYGDITDQGVEAVLRGCTKLEKLDLTLTGITKKTLELVATIMNIKVLIVKDCLEIKKDDVEALKQRRPDLNVITKTERPDAGDARRALMRAVRPRVYSETKGSHTFHAEIIPSVSAEERPLLSPFAFLWV